MNPTTRAVTVLGTGLIATAGLTVADQYQRTPITKHTSQVLKYKYQPDRSNNEANNGTVETSKKDLEVVGTEIEKMSIPNPWNGG